MLLIHIPPLYPSFISKSINEIHMNCAFSIRTIHRPRPQCVLVQCIGTGLAEGHEAPRSSELGRCLELLGRWECSAMSAGSWGAMIRWFNAFGSIWSNEECKNYQRLSIESDPKESDAKCEVESHQPSSKTWKESKVLKIITAFFEDATHK